VLGGRCIRREPLGFWKIRLGRAPTSVNTESRVSPIDKVGGDLGTDQFILQVKLDVHPAEVLQHTVEILEGNMHEPLC
jgi:hypothetical protein